MGKATRQVMGPPHTKVAHLCNVIAEDDQACRDQLLPAHSTAAVSLLAQADEDETEVHGAMTESVPHFASEKTRTALRKKAGRVLGKGGPQRADSHASGTARRVRARRSAKHAMHG